MLDFFEGDGSPSLSDVIAFLASQRSPRGGGEGVSRWRETVIAYVLCEDLYFEAL